MSFRTSQKRDNHPFANAFQIYVVEESLQDAGSLDAAVPPSKDAATKRNVHFEMRRQAKDDWSVQQSPTASDLRVLSQPTEVPNWKDVPNFVYQKQAGQGVFFYHVEFGINTQNDVRVFRNPSALRHWLTLLYLGSERQGNLYAYADSARINPSDTTGGHSTCSASKAVGNVYGVAKTTKIIMARMGGTILISSRSIASMFGIIRSDVRDTRREKKCVLNVSWGSEPPANGIIPQYWMAAIADMQELMTELDGKWSRRRRHKLEHQ